MDKLVTVATYRAALEAEAERLLLEQEGIRTFLADDNLVTTNWFLSNAVGGVKLQVAEQDARRATDILELHRAARTRLLNDAVRTCIRFACQECGKQVSVQDDRRGCVEICPHCGEYVDVPDGPAAGSPTVFTAAQDDPPETPDSEDRTTRQLWFEVLAVLCLAQVPHLFWAVASVVLGNGQNPPFVYQELNLIVRMFQVSMPVLVILSLSKEPWSRFGIVRISWLRDIAIGTAIWLAGMFVYQSMMEVLPSPVSVRPNLWAKPEGVAEYLLLLASSLANGFAEEFIMRGYLLTRFERLLRSTWLAVVVTTVLFASCHLYQGAIGVISATAIGFVYGASYCLLRRLWPVCWAHAVGDVLGVL